MSRILCGTTQQYPSVGKDGGYHTRTRDEDYPDEDDWAFLQK
jgi:hypothetical protein